MTETYNNIPNYTISSESKAKTILKPWGKEIWLDVTDKIACKRIYINAGQKTSLQFHNFKSEVNYVISGHAKLWIQDENCELKITDLFENDFVTILPKTIHRIEAVTDLILQESSTIELDDVIRVEDDTNRPDGKIDAEHQ